MDQFERNARGSAEFSEQREKNCAFFKHWQHNMLRIGNCRFVNFALMIFGIQRILYVVKIRRFSFVRCTACITKTPRQPKSPRALRRTAPRPHLDGIIVKFD